MSHHCNTCDIADGPVSMGFAAGPIVNGEVTAVPVTSCTLCKQPVRVLAEDVPPPAGYGLQNPGKNKVVRAPAASQVGTRVARAEVLPPVISGGNIIKAARARVRELNRALKEADAWRRERDDLVRLLKASKEKPVRTNVTPIKAAR